MGFYGIKLYDEDLACDIRDDYKDFLKLGKEDDELIEMMKKHYSECFSDLRDKYLFWLVIADTMWDYGRLTKKVKDKAIDIIKNEKESKMWEKCYMDKRKEILNKLMEKLKKEQPERKKVKKLKKRKGTWNYGDILTYQISIKDGYTVNDIRRQQIENCPYNGSYIVIKVIGIVSFNHGSLPREYDDEYSVFKIYNTIFSYEPTIEDIENLNEEFMTYVYPANTPPKLCLYSLTLNNREVKFFKLLKRTTEDYSEHYKYDVDGPYSWTDLRFFDHEVVKYVFGENKDTLKYKEIR